MRKIQSFLKRCFLKLAKFLLKSRFQLALGVFESVVDPADESHIIFHFLSPKIVSELAEQIGLDHVARLSNNGVFAESTASKYLLSQFGAINTLLNGITVARNYISVMNCETL